MIRSQTSQKVSIFNNNLEIYRADQQKKKKYPIPDLEATSNSIRETIGCGPVPDKVIGTGNPQFFTARYCFIMDIL